jgi:hypothetical protein
MDPLKLKASVQTPRDTGINIIKVDTKGQPTDMLTKGPPIQQFAIL